MRFFQRYLRPHAVINACCFTGMFAAAAIKDLRVDHSIQIVFRRPPAIAVTRADLIVVGGAGRDVRPRMTVRSDRPCAAA